MAGSLVLFVLRRAGAVVVVSVAVSATTFVMLHGLRPEAFNDPRPMVTKLADYLERAFLHLDLGRSNLDRQPVLGLIFEGVPADLSLFLGALAFGLLVGAAGGMVCAQRPRSLLARGALRRHHARDRRPRPHPRRAVVGGPAPALRAQRARTPAT